MVNLEKAKKRKEKSLIKRIFGYTIPLGAEYRSPLWLLPLTLILVPIAMLEDWCSHKQIWSEKKAKNVLDKTITKIIQYSKKGDYYFIPISQWTPIEIYKNAPLLYRYWAKCNEHLLKEYLLSKNYQIEGYDKKEKCSYYGDRTIIFIKNQ